MYSTRTGRNYTQMVKNLLRHMLLPSFEVLLFLRVFWTALFFNPDMLNSDGDLGRHITVGNYILNTRTLPSRDVFSHTRFGAPLVLHEWLSEVVFAIAHRVAGLNGVAWLTALLLLATYFLLAVSLRALGVSAPIAFLAALAAYFTGMIHFLPRQHLFSLLLFTLFVLLLELYRQNHRVSFLGFAFPPRIFLAFLPLLIWALSIDERNKSKVSWSKTIPPRIHDRSQPCKPSIPIF